MADEDASWRREVTGEELSVAFAGPAPGANRFFITLGKPGLRIAFAEQPSGSDVCYFRSAVTLHPFDGVELHRFLRMALDEVEKQMPSASEGGLDAHEDGE